MSEEAKSEPYGSRPRRRVGSDHGVDGTLLRDLKQTEHGVVEGSSPTALAKPTANVKKRDTRFKSGVSGNEARKWKPGQSGNPTGVSKNRTNFERAFIEALLSQGSPEEAAQLLWTAARSKEPWAIQDLCRRFAPPTQNLRLMHESIHDEIDYSKLSDEQLSQLDTLLQQAAGKPPQSEGGDGTPQAA